MNMVEMNRTHVGLDYTCSSISIFINKNLFYNIAQTTKPLRLKGMTSAEIKLKHAGETPLGNAYYNGDVIANVVSYGQLRNAGRILEVNVKDRFIVRGYHDQIYVFERSTKGDIYLCDLRRPRKTYETEAKVYAGTVQENLKEYTKREVTEAKEAGVLLRRMGYPSVRTALESIRRGVITNVKTPVNAFRRLIAIWGKPIALVKDKAKGHSKSPQVGELDSETIMGEPEREQSISMDLAFIAGVPFVVGRAKPVIYFVALEVKNKGAGKLEKMIQVFKKQIEKYGSRVKEIRFDIESAVKKLQDDLNLNVDLTGAGEAVPDVERYIGILRERVRAVMYDPPFRMPKRLIPHLVKFVSIRMNMLHTDQLSHVGMSGFEKLRGRKPTAEMFNLGFGEYVEAYNALVYPSSQKSSVSLSLASSALGCRTCVAVLHIPH